MIYNKNLIEVMKPIKSPHAYTTYPRKCNKIQLKDEVILCSATSDFVYLSYPINSYRF